MVGLKVFKYISVIDLLSVIPFLMEVRNIIPLVAVLLFLLIIGVLCLLYFQINNEDNFIGDVPI